MDRFYTSFDSLLEGVASNVERVMQEVAPEIETKLQASAVKNVHPKNGAETGGIADAKNIRSSVLRDGNVVSLTVKDIAAPQASYFTDDWSLWQSDKDAAVGGTMFANWIEHGLWMDIAEWNRMGRPKNDKPKRPARKFVSPAQVEAAMIVKTALHGL